MAETDRTEQVDVAEARRRPTTAAAATITTAAPAGQPPAAPSGQPLAAPAVVVDDLTIEDVSIDGMCGVY